LLPSPAQFNQANAIRMRHFSSAHAFRGPTGFCRLGTGGFGPSSQQYGSYSTRGYIWSQLFAEDYPQADFTLLYRGALRERREGIWALPGSLSQIRTGASNFSGSRAILGRREFSLAVHPLPFRDPLLEFRKIREPVGSPPGLMLGDLAYPVFSF
jgi:hypothetical protein